MASVTNWTGNHGSLSLVQKIQEQPPSTHLFMLPREVLIEIFLLMDWPDILRARRTCKELYLTSKERPIWTNMLKQTLLPPTKLDIPIEQYSDDALEKYALRIGAAYHGWCDSTPPYVSRKVTLEDGILHFYLSDSGRWLFLFTLHGAVYYRDLDNPDIPARLLIPWVLSGCYPLRLEYAVDVDEKAPTLAFNLTLYLDRCMARPYFQIWGVRLHTAFQASGYFTAEKLATFYREPAGSVSSVSLRGRFIAYAVKPHSRELFTPYIAIIDWKKIGLLDLSYHKLNYRKRVIFVPAIKSNRPPRFHLLSSNRLFVLYGVLAIIYDFLKERDITARLPIPYYGQTVFMEENSIQFGEELVPETLSRPFICPASNTVRMTVGWCPTGEIEDLTIAGLVIPLTPKHNQNEKQKQQTNETLTLIRSVMLQQDHRTLHPRFPTAAEQRAQQPREMDSLAMCFGYTRAVVRAEKRQLIALSYRWPDDPPPAGAGVGDVYKRLCENLRYDSMIPPVMSELAGRVVEFSALGYVVVHEFVGRPG